MDYPKDVKTKFARSVRNNVIAEAAIQLLRVGGTILLAHELAVSDFGVFRLLIIIATLAGLPSSAGLTQALVQRKAVSSGQEATVWWLSAGVGLFNGALLYVLAPTIGQWMAMPDLVVGIRLLAIPICVDCLSATSSARLQRGLRFGRLALAEVASEVAFVVTALAIVHTEWMRWSLALGLGARLAVRSVAIVYAEPVLPKSKPSMQAICDIRQFAAVAWGAGVMNVVSANADFLLVGKLLGASALGFYGLAWDLLRFIPDRLHKVAGRVTLPVFCQLQDDE
jgi:PST family polysaccharide transporter